MQGVLDKPVPIVFAICQGFQQLADSTINLLSIYDRLILARPLGSAGPETVTIVIFSIWTGAKGTYASIVRVRDMDGSTVAEVRSEFALENTSQRHYLPYVLVIPANPGVYSVTIGREEEELLRQDFTLELAAPAEPVQ